MFGALSETRTRTARATAPSRQRVYQFHHIGDFIVSLFRYFWNALTLRLTFDQRLFDLHFWFGANCISYAAGRGIMSGKIGQTHTGRKKSYRHRRGKSGEKRTGPLAAKYGLGCTTTKSCPCVRPCHSRSLSVETPSTITGTC